MRTVIMTIPRPAFLRFYRCFALCLITLIGTILTETANAQALNGSLYGDTAALQALLSRATSSNCVQTDCLLRHSSVQLTASLMSGITLRIRLDNARIPIETSRDTNEGGISDQSTRPILMKGIARMRHAPSRGGIAYIPVTATIFRDLPSPIVQLSVPSAYPRRQPAGVVVFVAKLNDLILKRQYNSRVKKISAAAFQTRSCLARALSSAILSSPIADWNVSTRSQSEYKILYIGTDYDLQYASKVKCATTSACHNKILSTVHDAAVFYERQLGYTLEVARQFGPTNHGLQTNSTLFLDQIQVYNTSRRIQYIHTGTNSTSNQVDIIQTFTGRTFGDDVIGIAYVGSACRNDQSEFANAIVQRVSDSLDPVTAAHELGHTLDAQHTASGIMKAALGSPPPTSFSSTSLLEMSSFLSPWYPQCRQGLSTGTLTPTPTPSSSGGGGSSPNPYQGKPVTLSLSVKSPTKRILTISSATTSSSNDCSVRIRVGTTSFGARSGTIISDTHPIENQISQRAAIQSGVIPSRSGNSYVYFVGEHTCSDGTILEVSRVRKIDPNRIRGVRSRISKRRWISALKKSLN